MGVTSSKSSSDPTESIDWQLSRHGRANNDRKGLLVSPPHRPGAADRLKKLGLYDLRSDLLDEGIRVAFGSAFSRFPSRIQ